MRLGQSEETDSNQRDSERGTALGVATSNPLHTQAYSSAGVGDSNSHFVLRVLNKESKVELKSLRSNSTIAGTEHRWHFFKRGTY